MAYDLGALVTRMVVEGRGAFEREIDAGGAALRRTAVQSDALGLSLGTMGTRTERLGMTAGLVGAEFMSLGDRGRMAFQQIGTGLTVAGLAIGALVGLAVYKYAEYDAAISRSVAVTGAYGETLERIRELTIDLGSSTVFTAREAAEGVTELGKAGVSTADILGGGLAGSLNLAAAGELAVADAAAITASTLNQFNLEGRDTIHVSDLLAAGAGKAQGSVQDMGLALKQAGLVSNQMGLSVEDTTGALAAFASAGLIGSDAGTSFRQMLLNLMTPTAQQKQLLRDYNLEAYDAQGNFIGLTAYAGKLQAAFQGVDQQTRDMVLGVTFGSDAIRAANILYQEGESGIRDWITAVDDSGYAARVAGINQDNLRGDIEKLGGAFDAALIKTGAGANGVLRDMVQNVTELVDSFTDLPDWMQQVVLGGAALTAGILLVGGALSIGVARGIEFRQNLAILAQQMPITAGAASRMAAFMAGPWGIAIAAAALGIQLLTQYTDSLKASSEEMQGAIRQSGGDIETLYATAAQGQALIDMGNNMGNIAEVSRRLADGGNPFSFFVDTDLNQTAGTLARLGEELAGMADTELPAVQTAFTSLSEQTDGSRSSMIGLLNAMPELRDKLIAVATANGTYSATMSQADRDSALLEAALGTQADKTLAAADAYMTAEEEAGALADQVRGLIDLINESNGLGQDAVTANAAWQESLAGVSTYVADLQAQYEAANGTLDGFSLSLDENTLSGSQNAAMLAQVAADAQTAAEKQYDLDVKTMSVKDATDKYNATLASNRDAFVNAATAAGFSATEVQKLTDKIYGVPSSRETTILANTATAANQIQGFIDGQSGRTIWLNVATSYAYNSGSVGGIPQGNNGLFRRSGVSMMADGDFRPKLSQQAPMMLGPGKAIIWREDETEGETFVPHALSKRVRSEQLLARTAAMFGGVYLPASSFMADGDVRGRGTEGMPPLARRVVDVGGIHFHNSVQRDPVDNAREAAQVVGSMLGIGG